jgi:hypothetical protein
LALKYGANPNGFNPYKDDTPIFKSLNGDNAKKLELIIGAKADVNFQNLDKDEKLLDERTDNYQVVLRLQKSLPEC